MMDLTKRVQKSLVGYANKGNEKVLGVYSSSRRARKELLFSELPQAFLKHVMAHSFYNTEHPTKTNRKKYFTGLQGDLSNPLLQWETK